MRINLIPKLEEYGKRKVSRIDAYYSRQKCRALGYDEITIRHDVAILTLEKAVDFTYSIRPIFVYIDSTLSQK